jgi:hypothetical protein
MAGVVAGAGLYELGFTTLENIVTWKVN